MAATGKDDREARTRTEKKMGQLNNQAQAFKKEGEIALEEARKAHEAAIAAQEEALNEARQAREVALVERAKDRWARLKAERKMSLLLKEADRSKVQSDKALEEARRINAAAIQAQERASREARQAREFAMATAQMDRQTKAEAAQQVSALIRELEQLKSKSEIDLENARRANEEAACARAQAEWGAQQMFEQQRVMMSPFGAFGGGGSLFNRLFTGDHEYAGDCGDSDDGYYDEGCGLRFYPGGQFIPGGGRSPKGGGYF